jgi:AbiV family abortive infection protein
LKSVKKRCRDIERKVPRTRIQEGIDLCKKNIVDYLQDARIIANEERFYHAVISAEFAVEELGKILLLKHSLKKGSEPVEIDGEEFCNHYKKAERSWNKVLDRKYRVLFSLWEDGMWEDGMWEKTELTEATRLECAFVDFIDNQWVLEKPIDAKLFLDFISHFEEKLKTV